MKIQIKHRYTGDVIFEHDCEDNNIKKTVLKAIELGSNLSYSNLRGSDLSGSDLSGSNLRGSDLSGSDLSGSNLSYSNLRGSDLSGSDLSYSNLSGSDLRGSDLRGSDLRGSDLRGSDLSGSDLSGSDLSQATTTKRYFQSSCIGSAKRLTTYCFDDDTIWCGCFQGTLKDFEKRVKETHKENPQYLKEYLQLIKFIKAIK